ncbi:lipopolysaccharide biosynthesis protein [Flavobacterium restrictum]|nr:MATE family efflux transporter [Flavobacterium restrictum]
MSVYKSIAKNLAASTFGMGVNFLSQIAMVPLFISFWGIDKYADWILITALSTIFMMSDMGLNLASNNEFVIKYHKKDYETCSKLQTNGFLFILFVFTVFFMISVFVSTFWGFKEILGVKQFSEQETSIGFILLLTDVFVIMYGRVYHGIFRATSRTHVVIVIDNMSRLGSLMVMFFGIYFGMNIINMLILYIIPDLLGVLYKHFSSRKAFDSGLSLSNFDSGVFKSIVKPSLAFMLFPLGQAVSSQGMVFVVNVLLGGTVLVAFTTTRTLVNFLRQMVNMLSISINPEICSAYGRNDYKTILNIYNRSLVITFVVTVGCIIFLLLTGKFIYTEWTKHTIVFNYGFFVGMLFVLLISCLTSLSGVIPLSTNTHLRFTTAFLISQISGVLLCFIFLKINPNILFIPFTLIITELALFIYSSKENNKFLNITLKEMCYILWYQSKFIFRKSTQFSR